ncbi:MAG: putative membrane protein [Psychroserpens sp.]|jgi:uncharacterized membrane protein
MVIHWADFRFGSEHRLFLFIGSILSIFLVGWFVLMFWVVWLIVRCAKGMKSLEDRVDHLNPAGWFF